MDDMSAAGNKENTENLLTDHAYGHCTEKYQTPIILAASEGNLEIMQFSIQHGVDVNSIDTSSSISLSTSAREGQFDIGNVSLAHDANVDLREQNHARRTIATARNNLKVVRNRLDKGTAVVSRSLIGETSLADAVQKGNLERVQFFLDHGADVNSIIKNDITLLAYAVHNGNLELARVLLAYGADVDIADELGYTTLFCATKGDRQDIVRLLLDYGANVNSRNIFNESLLVLAVKKGNLEIVKLFIDHGADVNSRSTIGATSLLFAVRGGNLEIIRLLLDHGADIESKVKCSEAVFSMDTDIFTWRYVKMLLKYGVDVDTVDNWGKTSLLYATELGKWDIVRLLLDYGANIESRNIFGETSLVLAIQKNNLETVQLFIERGAKVDSRGYVGTKKLTGRQAFCEAIDECDTEFLYFLLDHIADGASEEMYCKSALICASDVGNLEIVQILLDHGARVELPQNLRLNCYERRLNELLTRYALLTNPNAKTSTIPISHMYYVDKCKAEISGMSKHKIGHSTITFYSFLISDEHKLAICMKNQEVVRELSNGNYRNRFPMYHTEIERHYYKGITRQRLLNVGELIVSKFAYLPQYLPSEVCQKMFQLLRNCDLENFRKAGVLALSKNN